MDILKNEAVVTEFMNSEGYLRKEVWRNRSNALEASRPRCFGRGRSCRTWTGLRKWPEGLDELGHIFGCLQRLDAMIGQTLDRCALLFADNVSSQGAPTNLPLLQHIKLEFLPKNTTSLLQPLDLGMIACIKKRYKSLIAKRVVNLVDSGYIDNLYKVDIRTAGIWIYHICARLQLDVIYNCWTKSKCRCL